jgi:hypothetical protein
MYSMGAYKLGYLFGGNGCGYRGQLEHNILPRWQFADHRVARRPHLRWYITPKVPFPSSTMLVFHESPARGGYRR